MARHPPPPRPLPPFQAIARSPCPGPLRAKAISIVQSSWALGFAVAAAVAGPVSRYYGWRAVFFVGILPALVTLWIQGSVPESEMWRERNAAAKALPVQTEQDEVRASAFSSLFRPPLVKHTFALLLFNFFAMFGCRLTCRYQSSRVDVGLVFSA